MYFKYHSDLSKQFSESVYTQDKRKFDKENTELHVLNYHDELIEYLQK